MPRAVESLFAALALGACLAGAVAAAAETWPARPVRLVTGAPGSTAELTSRIVAQGLSGALGQSVVVDPRSTGGATVFGEIVARAQPDGHTLLIIGPTLWLGPLFRKAPYDPLRDFAPISVMTDSPNVLVVNPSVPVNSVRELIDLAKAKPNSLNYSTSGIGAAPHLAAELFKLMTGTRITHVPYKGAGASVLGVITGEVQLTFGSAASVTPHLQSGKLRAVAVSSAKPSPLFPDLPTIAATVPGFETGSEIGFFAPARTPVEIVTRLQREVAAYFARPDVRAKFLASSIEPVASPPARLAATLKSDTRKWSRVIREAGIRTE